MKMKELGQNWKKGSVREIRDFEIINRGCRLMSIGSENFEKLQIRYTRVLT